MNLLPRLSGAPAGRGRANLPFLHCIGYNYGVKRGFVAPSLLCVFLGVLSCLASALDANAEQSPDGIQINPKASDLAMFHKYVYLLILPETQDRPERVVFKSCSTLSRQDETLGTPNCEILGSEDGYATSRVIQTANSNKYKFFGKLFAEAGVMVAAEATGGPAGAVLGAASGVLDVSGNHEFKELRDRKSRRTIRAALKDHSLNTINSNRSMKDLVSLALSMALDLERDKKNQSAHPQSGTSVSDEQVKSDSPEATVQTAAPDKAGTSDSAP